MAIFFLHFDLFEFHALSNFLSFTWDFNICNQLLAQVCNQKNILIFPNLCCRLGYPSAFKPSKRGLITSQITALLTSKLLGPHFVGAPLAPDIILLSGPLELTLRMLPNIFYRSFILHTSKQLPPCSRCLTILPNRISSTSNFSTRPSRRTNSTSQWHTRATVDTALTKTATRSGGRVEETKEFVDWSSERVTIAKSEFACDGLLQSLS